MFYHGNSLIFSFLILNLKIEKKLKNLKKINQMSDNKIISRNNGRIITVKSGLCSSETCLKYAKDILKQLKDSTEYGAFFQNDKGDYEVNTLPMGIRNLSLLSKDNKATKDRSNYCQVIGQLESMLTAVNVYDPKDSTNDLFYKSFFNTFVNEVVDMFDKAGGKIKILSGGSFWRLDKAIVNVLLGKTPQGVDISKRRRKHHSFDENGEPIYYTEEEVKDAENELRLRNGITDLYQINVDHNPFTIRSIFLSICSHMSVSKYVDRTGDFNSVDDYIYPIKSLFSTVDDELYIDVCNTIRQIFSQDLEVMIPIYKSGKDIVSALDIMTKKTNTSMPYACIYLGLMKHVNFVIPFAVKFIQGVNDYTSGKIESFLGYNDFENENTAFSTFEKLLNSDGLLKKFISTVPVMFDYKISGQIFRYLLISIIRIYTNKTVNDQVVNFISKKIGATSETFVIDDLVMSLFAPLNNTVDDKLISDCIFNSVNCEKTVSGKKEELVCYLYRYLFSYVDNFENIPSDIKFLSKVILSCSEVMKDESYINDIDGVNVTIDIKTMIETVNKITGASLNESNHIFSKISGIVEKNVERLNNDLKRVENDFDAIYGEKYNSTCIPLPPIDFSFNDLKWIERKINSIKGKIDAITKSKVDFVKFQELYDEMENIRYIRNNSPVDDPRILNKLKIAEDNYNEYVSYCTNFNDGTALLSSADLDKYKKLQKDLYHYTHTDKIRMKFEPFTFKFKESIGLTLSYNISNCFLRDGENSIKRGMSLYETRGDEWIINYFDPFFRPFATVAVEAFKIEVVHTKVKSKKSINVEEDVLLIKVTYGNSDDAHNATKFRTDFPSILDISFLLREAKKFYKIDSDEYDISMVKKEDFKIRWFKTQEQIDATAGRNNETTLGIYDDYEGCIEEYPFYDSQGKIIVLNSFNKINASYKSKLNTDHAIEVGKIRRFKEREAKESGERIIQNFINERRKNGIKTEPTVQEKNLIIEAENKRRTEENKSRDESDKFFMIPLFKVEGESIGPKHDVKPTEIESESFTLWKNIKLVDSDGKEVKISDSMKSLNIPNRTNNTGIGRSFVRSNVRKNERRTHEGVIQQPNVIRNAFYQREMINKPDAEGFVMVYSGRKTLKGRIVTGNTPGEKPIEKKNDRFTKPYKQNNGKREGGRSSSTEIYGSNGRSNDRRSGSPYRKNENKNMRNSSSPGTGKRGHHVGASSPFGASPSIDEKMIGSEAYLQFKPETFTMLTSASPSIVSSGNIFNGMVELTSSPAVKGTSSGNSFKIDVSDSEDEDEPVKIPVGFGASVEKKETTPTNFSYKIELSDSEEED